jgi:Cu2+-exporting ATPase
VISCPCALSLAIPAALSAAHAALARHGLLGLRADALDALAGADTIVLDKTGTLSTGRPRLAGTTLLGALDAGRVGAIAAALEAGSGHPLERAFAAPGAAPASDRRTHPGLGIEGVVDGRRWRLGRADFAAGEPDDGALWLGDGVRAEARFAIQDPLRPEAASAIAALQAQGLAVELLSGDAPGPVAAAAVAMGGLPWRARQSPEDKLAHVRALQAAGHRVAMVGDGINDGPVLAGADVAIALAGGAPLAHRAADVVLLGDDLGRLADAVHLARRTRAVVRQNLAWASAYNLVAIPFAVAGVVTPWIAALGMAGSSLLVTLNALRLARSGGAERRTSPGRAERQA